MECIYHEGEETTEQTCSLCLKPVCMECILMVRQFGYSSVFCPKCLRAITGCWFDLDERADR